MITPPPRLIVFDAIETTFSLEPLRGQFAKAGAAPSSLEMWFARLLRDACALTAAGGYAPFRDLAQGALETVLAYHLVSARADLEPHEAALVTVHGWDICGARHAGLRTGWCSRLEHHLSRPLGPADVEGDTLIDVVAALVSK